MNLDSWLSTLRATASRQAYFEAEPIDGFPLGFPVELEVGFGVKKGIGGGGFRPVDGGEFWVVFHFLTDPLVVFGVIGFKEELAAGDEHLVEGVEEGLLHESAFVVPGFGPWIRAEEVKAGNGVGLKQPFEGVLAFETEEFHIGESQILDLTADATDTAKQSLDADEVALGELLSHFDEEFAIATAEIDFQWVIVTKDIAGCVSAKVVIGYEFARFSRAGAGGGSF